MCDYFELWPKFLKFLILCDLLKQKEGPAPGQYECYKESEVNNCLKATAPFKSNTPRFIAPHKLVSCNILSLLLSTHLAVFNRKSCGKNYFVPTVKKCMTFIICNESNNNNFLSPYDIVSSFARGTFSYDNVLGDLIVEHCTKCPSG